MWYNFMILFSRPFFANELNIISSRLIGKEVLSYFSVGINKFNLVSLYSDVNQLNLLFNFKSIKAIYFPSVFVLDTLYHGSVPFNYFFFTYRLLLIYKLNQYYSIFFYFCLYFLNNFFDFLIYLFFGLIFFFKKNQKKFFNYSISLAKKRFYKKKIFLKKKQLRKKMFKIKKLVRNRVRFFNRFQ